MEKFDAYRLRTEYRLKVISIDAVLGNESLQDVESLGCELVCATIFEEVGGRIRCVFNETGIHEVLAHGLGHIAGHGKGRGRRSRHNTCRFSGIRPSIRLREL